jgi:hypothetical protein
VILPLSNYMNRAAAALLTTLLVALSVCVPMLERADRAHGPVIESEHNASTCVQGHDHTVCTQYNANRLVPSPLIRPHGTSREDIERSHRIDEVATAFARATPQRSRAPPLG